MLNTKYPTIVLLNGDEPILTVINTPEGYILIDQYEDLTVPSILNEEEMKFFLNNELGSIANSKGELIQYYNYPQSMKQVDEVIESFFEKSLADEANEV